MVEMHISIGIDLGTTNTTCTVLKTRDGVIDSVVQLPILQLVLSPSSSADCFQKERILPSVIWMSDRNVYTGRYCKESAGKLSDIENSFIIKSIKREMGNDAWQLDFNSNIYSVRQISAYLLKTILLSLKSDFPDAIIDSIIITIPASFSSKMRKNTIEAAISAGFEKEKLFLIDEPIAAVFSKWNETEKIFKDISTNENIMIFDMGGGTIDVSILKISPNEKTVQVLSTSRYNDIAGDDLDLEISALLLKKTTGHEEYNNYFSGNISKKNAFELLLHAEKIKIQLNEISPAYINGGLIGLIKYCKDHSLNITVDLAKSFSGIQPSHITLEAHEILSCLSPFLVREESHESDKLNVFVPVYQALKRAGIDVYTIRHVYTVGGSTKFIPLLCELRHFFSGLSSNIIDPDYAVSEGAAKFAYMTKNENWHILEVTHEKVFIKRSGLPFLEILRDKIVIPCDPIKPSEALSENNTYEVLRTTKNIFLEFYQGTCNSDPAMSLIHTESKLLEKPLTAKSTISDIEGWIDRNKIYHFNIKFKEPQGNIIDVSFEFSGDIDLIEKDYKESLKAHFLNGTLL